MLDFRQMPYERPDMDALRSGYEQAIAAISHAENYGDARTAFFALQAQEQQSGTHDVALLRPEHHRYHGRVL